MTLGFLQVSNSIWRLEIKYKVLGLLSLPVSVWLVRSGADWILIDTGPPESGDQVVAAIAKVTEYQGPRQILLTHAHADHSGGLGAIGRHGAYRFSAIKRKLHLSMANLIIVSSHLRIRFF